VNDFRAVQLGFSAQEDHPAPLQQGVHHVLPPLPLNHVRVRVAGLHGLVRAILQTFVVDVGDGQLLVLKLIVPDPLNQILNKAAE